MLLPDTRSVDVASAMDWLQTASDRAWLTLSIDEYNGVKRPNTHRDLVDIAREYSEGIRDADDIRQILDRSDLWLEISDRGKQAVKTIWPQMPEQA